MLFAVPTPQLPDTQADAFHPFHPLPAPHQVAVPL